MKKAITTKEDIIGAFLTAAREQGFSKLGMRQIAERCGIAPGTLYNYYSDKNELILDAIASIWEESLGEETEAEDLLSYIAEITSRIAAVEKSYPGFLQAHSEWLTGAAISEGRKAMGRCIGPVIEEIGILLERECITSDPDIDIHGLSSFILDCMIQAAKKGESRPEELITLLSLSLRQSREEI